MNVKRRRHLQRLILRRTAARNRVIKKDKYSQLKLYVEQYLKKKKEIVSKIEKKKKTPKFVIKPIGGENNGGTRKVYTKKLVSHGCFCN